jgi:hypothetical protein
VADVGLGVDVVDGVVAKKTRLMRPPQEQGALGHHLFAFALHQRPAAG